MNKRYLKRYLLLAFLLWALSAIFVLVQHLAVQSQSASLNMLAGEFEAFKSSLVAPENNRLEQLAKLERGVVRISSALQVVKEDKGLGFISSDLTQLAYLTERFKSQASDYIGLQLNRRELSVQIEHETHHGESSEALPFYNELGSFLFGAFYANEHSDEVDYLVLESLLNRSKVLSSPDKQTLQNLLSLTSTVLAEQAQVQNLSAALLDNSIRNEVGRMDGEYVGRKSGLLYLLIISSFSALLFILVMTLGDHLKTEESMDDAVIKASNENQDRVLEPVLANNLTPDQHPLIDMSEAKPTEWLSNITQPEIESVNTESDKKIDIEYMLDTFEQDIDSVIMVLEVFLNDHQNDAEKIKKCFESDRELALRSAHSLKGVAGNLGATDLKETALRLEKTLGDCTEAPQELFLKLKDDLSLVVTEVLSYLKTVK